jgi:lipopolysaccharide exporter
MSLLSKLQNQPGLFGRLARGGAWLGIGSASEQGFRFVRNMILARILAPEAFGLMAIVISVCSLLQVLTGIGIKESIVQSPHGAERTYLNGAWWLGLVRGVTIYGLALLLAPWLARFYEAPELAAWLRVAFVGVLAQGALSAGAYVAVKQMRYSRWVLVQQGGSIIGILTTLTLAFILKGVWALVIGYATEGVARCIMSYLVCPFRPGLKFRKEDLQALFRFAGGMFGLPILMMIYNEGAVFAVGKLCSKEQLGIFAMALTLARIPSMFSNQLVDLLMPAFSEIQRDFQRVNEGILKVTTVAVLLGLPAVCFTAIYGAQILSAVYGQRYASGALALSFSFLNELLLVCSVPMATVYLALGKPALLRRFSMIRAALMLLFLYPMISHWGIAGAATVPLLAMIAAYGFQLARLRSITSLNVTAYVAICFRGMWLAAGCVCFWMITARLFAHQKPLLALAGSAFLTACFGSICAVLMWRKNPIRKYFWPFGDVRLSKQPFEAV